MVTVFDLNFVRILRWQRQGGFLQELSHACSHAERPWQ